MLYPRKYGSIVKKEAKEYDLPQSLVYAVIKAESDLLDPEISIKYGCALLRVLLNEYDNLATAVCAYNAGMGNVTSWLSDPAYSEDGVTLKEIPFEETRLYVQKVLQYKETYEKLYGGIENG